MACGFSAPVPEHQITMSPEESPTNQNWRENAFKNTNSVREFIMNMNAELQFEFECKTAEFEYLNSYN